jgi:hypothetical protein
MTVAPRGPVEKDGDVMMTPGVIVDGGEQRRGSKLQASKRDGERKMLMEEELAEMPLESLLYYVLVGDGRRSL